jgi:hypothetical protein
MKFLAGSTTLKTTVLMCPASALWTAKELMVTQTGTVEKSLELSSTLRLSSNLKVCTRETDAILWIGITSRAN